MSDWKDLTAMIQGKPIRVERVRLEESRIAIEGSFELPPLAQLSMEDQIFVAQFIGAHGSIKEMERLFDVSYPTIKNRLNKISQKLGVEVRVENDPAPSKADILTRLEKGEISVQEAMVALKS